MSTDCVHVWEWEVRGWGRAVGVGGRGGQGGGGVVGRTREGLTAEVNLEITTTAWRVVNQRDVASPESRGGREGGGGWRGGGGGG